MRRSRQGVAAPAGLRFPGQWFQAEGGLHQNWMRDYAPALGRYLLADPPGLVDGASVYGYAMQNPGRWTDQYGFSAQVPHPSSLDHKGAAVLGYPEFVVNRHLEVYGYNGDSNF